MNKIFLFVLTLLSYSSYSQNDFKAKTKQSKISLVASFGPSFRIGKTPNNYPAFVRDYIKELKSGFSYDASILYDINKKLGVGLKFNVYQSKGSLENVSLTSPSGVTGVGTTSDNIKITFIGPFFSSDYRVNNKMDNFRLNFALGYMQYLDDTQVLGNYKIKGATLGMNTDLTYYFGLNKNCQLGPKLGLIGGVIRKFDVTGPNGYYSKLDLKDTPENLWRIDLSLVARYKF
jgi:long-subunit fatty acid transport protein